MARSHTPGRLVSADDVDDTGATVLHVDMDAFFAAVEILEDPSLAGKPVVIGHPSGRSVVSTASYEARRYGVNSAMPMATALRLCPDAIVVPPRHALYAEYSRRVMRVFHDITPTVEPLSIDEAFLDVSGAVRLLGRPASIGRMLRERVAEETGLTCSVGVAGTKFLAKLASGMAKPDGLLVIPVDGALDILHPLPIRALWGVGGKTEESLARLGLRTVGDVAETPLPVLRRAVGDASAARLHDLANGRDARRVETERVEKSVGHEETFETDVADAAFLERELLRLSDRVAARLRSEGLTATTVSIKVRSADFSTKTRSRSLPEPTCVGRRIYEESVTLFRELCPEVLPVRLIGVRAERLSSGGHAASLWDPDEAWRDTERTVDSLRARFGTAAVTSASLLRKDAPPDRAR